MGGLFELFPEKLVMEPPVNVRRCVGRLVGMYMFELFVGDEGWESIGDVVPDR